MYAVTIMRESAAAAILERDLSSNGPLQPVWPSYVRAVNYCFVGFTVVWTPGKGKPTQNHTPEGNPLSQNKTKVCPFFGAEAKTKGTHLRKGSLALRQHHVHLDAT